MREAAHICEILAGHYADLRLEAVNELALRRAKWSLRIGGEARQYTTIAFSEMGMTVEESTAIFHYPHPDMLVRGLERLLRKLSGHRLDGAIRKGLSLLDKLEGRRSKYLTGRYIAVKAVKK